MAHCLCLESSSSLKAPKCHCRQQRSEVSYMTADSSDFCMTPDKWKPPLAKLSTEHFKRLIRMVRKEGENVSLC